MEILTAEFSHVHKCVCVDIQRAEIYSFFPEKVTEALSGKLLLFTPECSYYQH